MSFSYTYNLADALVQTTYPSGRMVTNSYDAAGRIAGVSGVLGNGSPTQYVGGTCSARATAICYAASGAPNSFKYGNSLARSYTYNGRFQPTVMADTLSGSTLLSLNYTFGVTAAKNNGNPSQVVLGTGFTQAFGYDKLNRLNSFTDSGGAAQTLNYDSFGNVWQTGQIGLGSVAALGWMPTAQSSFNAANNQLVSSTGAQL